MADYNGWKNYETWNVALYISNDEPTYRLAQSIARTGTRTPFRDFAAEYGRRTPDNVSLSDKRLSLRELNAAIRETIA
jgi:hypothetical protein